MAVALKPENVAQLVFFVRAEKVMLDADLAKCPPVAGLYAALGGMVTFALFTTSRHVIAGPDAAVAILVGKDRRHCVIINSTHFRRHVLWTGILFAVENDLSSHIDCAE